MGRFTNKRIPQVGVKSAVETVDNETVVGHGGFAGTKRGAKGELLTLAASFMGGDSNFYENTDGRYGRLISLIHDPDVYTDEEWLWEFINYTRNTLQMRTVSVVVAVEAVIVRLKNEQYGSAVMGRTPERISNRTLVDVACSRADEPAEVMGYWLAMHGGLMPKPIKNGIGDAAKRLYNEFSFLKYGESQKANVSMLDVLRMTHPEAGTPEQNILFEYITSKDREATLAQFPTRFNMIRTRKTMYGFSPEVRRAMVTSSLTPAFKGAGFSWENVSEWSPEGMSGRMWDAMIPNMGLMALIRNLRNFDEKGISDESFLFIINKFLDPDAVLKSRILPYQFYSAYRSLESVRWSSMLETALQYSLSNIPKLGGDTCVMVDMSGSMFGGKVSEKSDITYADIAGLFATAWKLANVGRTYLYQFGSEYAELATRYQTWLGARKFSDYKPEERWTGVTKKIELSHGGSVLRGMTKFQDMGGTMTHRAVEEIFCQRRYDRLILITDEQGFSTPNYDNLPVHAGTPVYVWNLAGYQSGISRYGKYQRHSFAGLTDNAFRQIPILESGTSTSWPWKVK